MRGSFPQSRRLGASLSTFGDIFRHGSATRRDVRLMQERLRQLEVATAALITDVSLDGVLRRVVQVAAEVIGARYAAIGVVGPGGKLLESFITHGIDPEVEASIGAPPRGHGILGLVISEGKPIRLPDLRAHPASRGFPPNHPPMRSFLGVPIVGRRGVFGNLYLTEKTGGEHFTGEDEDIAILLAAKAAAAVENARHHEESAQLLETLLHHARDATGGRTMPEDIAERRERRAEDRDWGKLPLTFMVPSRPPPLIAMHHRPSAVHLVIQGAVP